MTTSAPAPTPADVNTSTRRECPDSWALVAAAQRGDRDAFGQFYERYVDQVFAYHVRRIRDRSLAEDLTSETFLRMLRRLDSFSQIGDVGALLTTIARNLLIDHLKSSRNRRLVLTDDIEQFTVNASTGRSAEDEVVDRETADELARYVAQLDSAGQRECIRLRFAEGLSSAETAAVMGLPEMSVRGLRHRAVRKLAWLMTYSRATAGSES